MYIYICIYVHLGYSISIHQVPRPDVQARRAKVPPAMDELPLAPEEMPKPKLGIILELFDILDILDILYIYIYIFQSSNSWSFSGSGSDSPCFLIVLIDGPMIPPSQITVRVFNISIKKGW